MALDSDPALAALEVAASALRADLAARGIPADELGEAVMLSLAVIRDQHDRAYATWLSVERRVRDLERRIDDALSLDVADGIVLGPSRFSDPADMAAIEREVRVLEERVRLEQLIRSRANATPPEAPRPGSRLGSMMPPLADRGPRDVAPQPPPEAPRFRHDCESCVFLGRSTDGMRDLYLCNREGVPPQLLIRFGDPGGLHEIIHPVRVAVAERESREFPSSYSAEAYRRAVARGLVGGEGEGG